MRSDHLGQRWSSSRQRYGHDCMIGLSFQRRACSGLDAYVADVHGYRASHMNRDGVLSVTLYTGTEKAVKLEGGLEVIEDDQDIQEEGCRVPEVARREALSSLWTW